MTTTEKIKKIRELNNFSQEQMAEKLNMSVNSYAKLERGETRLYVDRLEQIAQILNIHVADLLSKGGKSFICVIGDSHTSTDSFNYYENDTYKDELLKSKEAQIEQLQQHIKLLNDMLNLLKK